MLKCQEFVHIFAELQCLPKLLGTFPVLCAIDEMQNPLPLKIMLFERHMISIIGISDIFPNS